MANTKLVKDALECYSREAFDNLIKNFWDEKTQSFQNKALDIMWARTVVLLALETYYKCTKDERVIEYLRKDRDYWVRNREDKERRDWLLTVGGGNNPGLDDCSWSCLGFFVYYRYLGDEYSLELCHDLIGRAFDYLADDGDPSKGLWYRRNDATRPDPWDQNQYSICGVGLLLAELDYYNMTKGTDKEDLELHKRAMGYYQFAENYLRRSVERTSRGITYPADNIYWMALYVDPETKEQYTNGTRPIGHCSSYTSLFGNTAMCVINKKLYDMTGEKEYLDKVISACNSLVSIYGATGILLNDRDCWANCAFLSYFVEEVLPLPQVPKELAKLFVSTSLSIQKYSLFEGGYYGGDWGDFIAWGRSALFGDATRATTSCNTINMLLTGYYILCKGLTEATDEQEKQIPITSVLRKFNEATRR